MTQDPSPLDFVPAPKRRWKRYVAWLVVAGTALGLFLRLTSEPVQTTAVVSKTEPWSDGFSDGLSEDEVASSTELEPAESTDAPPPPATDLNQPQAEPLAPPLATSELHPDAPSASGNEASPGGSPDQASLTDEPGIPVQNPPEVQNSSRLQERYAEHVPTWNDDRLSTPIQITIPAKWPNWSGQVSSATKSALSFHRGMLSHRKARTIDPAVFERLAVDSEDRCEFERLARIAFQLDLFWRAVEAEMDSLKVGDQLLFGPYGRTAEITMIAPGEMELQQANGKRKKFVTKTANISAPIAAAIADRRLSRGGASRLLPQAVFWSIDHRGKPEIAALIWQRAVNQGLPVAALDSDLPESSSDE